MTSPPPVPVHLVDQRSRKSVWALAAVLALCGHVALAAFAIKELREEPDDEELGAPGIVISVDLASPAAEPSEAPPGPESEASAATAPVVEQNTTEKDVDLPKEAPVETDDPDRLVTTDTSKLPDDEAPTIKNKAMKPTEQSVAQEATAPPVVETPPKAEKSTTPDQGTGQARQRTRVRWQKELVAHLDRYKRYPPDRRQMSAEALVTLTLDRAGRVLAATIAKSSGDAAFDRAAISMVERASPVPAPPPLIADEGLTFSLPVVFRKNRQ